MSGENCNFATSKIRAPQKGENHVCDAGLMPAEGTGEP